MAGRKSIVYTFALIYTLFVIGFVLVLIRMAVIMTVERSSWLEQAGKENKSTEEIKAERGNLLSDDGSMITATIPYYNCYIDMRVGPLSKDGGKLYKENVDSLSICLSNMFKDRSKAEYRAMLDKGFITKKSRLKVTPRKISYLEYLKLKTFPILREHPFTGGLISESKDARVNLYGSLANRTVGDINSDGKGEYGLELYYDSLLSGENGVARRHRSGTRWISVNEIEPENGVDIYTTIDLEIQDICEKAMRDKLEVVKANDACLVLMEVKTGAIKSIVNLRRTSSGNYIEAQNMAMADMSEPGSTFKTVSLMVALDNNICDTADLYDINHGRWKFYSATMTDHNWRRGGYDTLSVSQILAYSSNVGVSRIIGEYYKDKPGEFVDAVKEMKIGEDINIDIPGAGVPSIPHPDTYKYWSGISLPWMSIGYVVRIPPIYTLNFYNAIANGGKLMRPYLVKEIRRDGSVIESRSPEVIKSSICKSSTLKKVQGMLEGVVEYGTARSIKSDNFKIAGKTGTAQLGYGKGRPVKHQVTFCGYFPADAPMYSCIVVMREPQMIPAAAFMSGEVFKNVAERVYAQKMNVEIDDLERWEGDSIEPYNLPRVKYGKREYVERAMNQADVDYEDCDAEWIILHKEGDELKAESRPLLDNLVPNVVGMGAADAVYLMEKRGLYVQLYGRGRVVSQSLRSGDRAVKGQTVTLKLK